MKNCKCKDCGLEFKKGEQGDNEEFCLKCEYIASKNEYKHRFYNDEIDYQRELSEGCLDDYSF